MAKNDSFVRNPLRELPDGSIARVFPFHVSLEGRETKVLCRDVEDYDVFVKVIVLCSRRRNVILLAYSVVSNHAHCVVLATNKKVADAFGDEVKKIYSMYFRRRYDDTGAMRRMNVNSQWLDSEWYLRNAIAYDIRNAMDNGACSVQNYEWTSYRAYFADSRSREQQSARCVSSLSKAERRAVMRTGEDLMDVSWLVDEDGRILPGSVCDWRYVEAAFEGNPTMFLQRIGLVNVAEMSEKLIDGPRQFRRDEEVVRAVGDICRRWFSCDVHNLPVDKKCRVIPYYFRSNRTSVAQLARVFELSRDAVAEILRKNGL